MMDIKILTYGEGEGQGGSIGQAVQKNEKQFRKTKKSQEQYLF